MPYENMKDVPDHLRKHQGVPLSLSQVNHWAEIYDSIKDDESLDEPAAVAWETWGQSYTKRDEKWVEDKSSRKLENRMRWRASFEKVDKPDKPFSSIWKANHERYPFVARVIDTTVNANRWAIPESEIDNVISQLAGKQLRIDHSNNKVRNIIGVFSEAWQDPDDETSILAKGWIDDEYVAKLVHNGSVTDVSIAGEPEKAYCSECKKSVMKGPCGCDSKEAYEIIENMKVTEISVVTEGAYTNAKIMPNFSASVNDYIHTRTEFYKETTMEDNSKVAEIKCESGDDVMPEDEKEKENGEDDYESLVAKISELTEKFQEYDEKVKGLSEALSAVQKDDEEEKEGEEEDEKEETKAQLDKLKSENEELREKLASAPKPSGAGKTVGTEVPEEREGYELREAINNEWVSWLEDEGFNMRKWTAWKESE